MAITQGHGNPKWTRDETILALDLYFDFSHKLPSASDESVIKLSDLLRALPYHGRTARKITFRNPAGVSFKLQNLRQVATGNGLGNVSEMDRLIWSEFANHSEKVKEAADLIRTGIEIAETEEDESDEELEFVEGRTVTEVHKRRERNPRLRRALIKKLKLKGPLECEICSCTGTPGLFSESIFEAHHVVPLFVGSERKTKLSDLALLCANCHRMLHHAIAYKKEWIEIATAKMLFKTF